MSLPLWDPIELPPDFTLIDVNSIEDEDERLLRQSQVLEMLDENPFENPREWSDDEGMFLVLDASGAKVGLALILDTEDAS